MKRDRHHHGRRIEDPNGRNEALLILLVIGVVIVAIWCASDGASLWYALTDNPPITQVSDWKGKAH